MSDVLELILVILFKLYLVFGLAIDVKNINVHFLQWHNDATKNWVKDVPTSGIFTCPSILNVSTTSESRVPDGWTVVTF